MNATSGHLPDVPRYLVPLSAMLAWRESVMLTDEIGVVTYSDHLTAMQQQRDTALREALAAVEAVIYGTSARDGVSRIDRAKARAAVQRLIDGGGQG